MGDGGFHRAGVKHVVETSPCIDAVVDLSGDVIDNEARCRRHRYQGRKPQTESYRSLCGFRTMNFRMRKSG